MSQWYSLILMPPFPCYHLSGSPSLLQKFFQLLWLPGMESKIVSVSKKMGSSVCNVIFCVIQRCWVTDEDPEWNRWDKWNYSKFIVKIVSLLSIQSSRQWRQSWIPCQDKSQWRKFHGQMLDWYLVLYPLPSS